MTASSPSASTPGQVRVEEMVFDVVDEGPRDGEVVLLLHGFPQTSHSWRHVRPALVEAGYRVLAPDQRGYSPGARPEGADAYDMPHLLGDVLGVLDGLGVERAHVVGHDWGAAVAWQLASRHPQRVRTLTAVSVPHPLEFTDALRHDEDQRRRSQYMLLFKQPGKAEEVLLEDGARRLRELFGVPGVDVERYVALMQEPDVLTKALNWYRATKRADNDGLEPVTVPTTYVWSDGDEALGRTAAEGTAQHIAADYRFVELSGVSHWVPEEAPDALVAAVLERLRG